MGAAPTYGPKKIQDELADQGILAGLNRIKRLRKLHSIRCTHKKKFKVTTDSKHNLPVAPNELNRQFAQTTAPNQVWWPISPTSRPTRAGCIWRHSSRDLHTCEIVGWTMDSRMTHHSDRGSQHCSGAYRALQASYGMQTSMSRKGNCWDKAPMESFFGTLKAESLHHYRFATPEQARQVVFADM